MFSIFFMISHLHTLQSRDIFNCSLLNIELPQLPFSIIKHCTYLFLKQVQTVAVLARYLQICAKFFQPTPYNALP